MAENNNHYAYDFFHFIDLSSLKKLSTWRQELGVLTLVYNSFTDLGSACTILVLRHHTIKMVGLHDVFHTICYVICEMRNVICNNGSTALIGGDRRLRHPICCLSDGVFTWAGLITMCLDNNSHIFYYLLK